MTSTSSKDISGVMGESKGCGHGRVTRVWSRKSQDGVIVGGSQGCGHGRVKRVRS